MNYQPQITSKVSKSTLKKTGGILVSLTVPPLGILLAGWMFIRARKQVFGSYYVKWGLILLLTSMAGGVLYTVLYINNQTRQAYIYPDNQSKSNITVCLDGKQTITITEESPYSIDIGESDASGRITPTLARIYLEKANGDFEVGVGANKGLHHIDEGECPSSN